MANLQGYSVTRNGSVNINNFPRYTITGRIEEVNPATGLMENLVDFTGGNALVWPAVLTTLTAEQRDTLLNNMATSIIRMKAGLE